MRSARRCCLCLYLKRDFSEKEGQIAHLDHDKTNGSEENLAFLCLAHHSLYDSKTSQHKNYTFAETKAAREKLVQRVERFSDEDGEEEREEDTEEESEEPLDDRDEIARLRARGERVYTFEMLDGQQLVGAVSANGFINLLICTKRQYEQWIDSDDDEIVPYVYYEFAEDIRRRSFDFVAPRNGSFVLVLINRSNKDVEMTIDWAWWDTDEED